MKHVDESWVRNYVRLNSGGGGASDHEILSNLMGGNPQEHWHLTKQQVDLVNLYKGYFESEDELNKRYPTNSPTLKGGEYAFVDDPDVGVYMFEFTPVRKIWVRDASVNWISKSELEQGIMLKSYATLNPVQNDLRFRKSGHKTIVESFDNDSWTMVTTIGSITTDTFNMQSDANNSMVGFNDIVNDRYSSLMKHRVTANQFKGEFINEYGSLERPLVLSSKIGVIQSIPNDVKKIIVSQQGTNEFPSGHYKFMFRPNTNIEFDTAEFNVKETTRARMWIIEQISGTMAYESQTRRDSIDTNGTLIIDDISKATTGLISATFPRLGALCEGVEYEIHMEIFEGVMYGSDDFITFAINGQSWKDESLITNKNLNDTLSNGFIMGTDSGIMGRGKPTEAEPDGEPRLICVVYENETNLGDVRNPVVLNTDKDLKVRKADGNVSNIATEDYARSVSNLEKVFNTMELDRDQTGILIQTKNKTYTMYDEEDFPTYNIYEYLASFGLSFRPNRFLTSQILFVGGDSNPTTLKLIDGVAVLNTVYYDENENPQTITLDLSKTTDAPEGWGFPRQPYFPDLDTSIESKKEWRFDSIVVGTQLTVTLIDPNKGIWQAVVEKASYLSNVSPFSLGQEGSEKLGRIWDTSLIMRESMAPDCKWFDINNYQGEVISASLVTRHKKAPYDVADKMAIHKYKEETKDFHTFFNDTVSGVYRCFGMEENLPVGYILGDNDFYVNVYAVSQYYKCLEAIDIRSGRRFIKMMNGGDWLNWVETGGVTSIPLVPKSILKTHNAKKGIPTSMSLAELSIVKGDVLSISCGTRGMAIEVSDATELTNYSASYCLRFEDDELLYYIDTEGVSKCSMEIFKYMPQEVEPPKPWKPYLKLESIPEEFTLSTVKGTVFEITISSVSPELVRSPFIVIDGGVVHSSTPVIFDGKEKYSFVLPFNIKDYIKEGEEISFKLSWNDQLGAPYEGQERVIKTVLA